MRVFLCLAASWVLAAAASWGLTHNWLALSGLWPSILMAVIPGYVVASMRSGRIGESVIDAAVILAPTLTGLFVAKTMADNPAPWMPLLISFCRWFCLFGIGCAVQLACFGTIRTYFPVPQK